MHVELSAHAVDTSAISGMKALLVTENVKFWLAPMSTTHASVPVVLKPTPPHNAKLPEKFVLCPQLLPATSAAIVAVPCVLVQVAAKAVEATPRKHPAASKDESAFVNFMVSP